MRLWQKILIGSGIGLLIGIFLPLAGGDTFAFLKAFSDIFTGIGTYILFPLVLAQVIVTTSEIREERSGFSFASRSIVYLLICSLALSVLGGLSMLIISPENIDIIFQESTVDELPSVQQFFQTIISPNALQVLSGDTQYMLAVFVFAVILGLGIHSQKTAAKPMLDLAEAASRVFYFLNRTFVEVMVVGTGVMAAARIVSIRDTPDIKWFGQVFAVIGVLVVLIVFVVYPLIIYFVGKKHRPFAWIRQLLAPAIVGLFSGNSYVPLGFLIRTGNEELRLSRRVWSWYYPLASIIGRAGTALVTSSCFVLVLRSYSKLEISILQFLLIVFGSMVISLAVGSIKAGGVLVSLSVLSTWYGQGLEEGFLILQQAGPILISLAVFLDVATQAFVAYLVSLLSNGGRFDENQPGSGKFRDEFMLS